MESRSKRPDRKAKITDQNKVLKLKKYFDKRKTTPKAGSETQDDTSKDPPENKSLDFKVPPSEATSEDKNSGEAAEIRPDSPEPNCAICLEPLTNKSFTDSCFHTFCFTCLVEWSRVKPECPLCKQRFKSIVHNVQKDYTYEEYHITSGRSPHNLWTFLNETPRFRYPTTMTPLNILRRNLESLQESLHDQESFYNQRLNSQIESHRRRYAPHSVSVFSESSMASRPSYNFNFRNRVYTHDLWVMPAVGDRVRTVSPEFYRRNPACTHRLLPWLNRELVALLQNQETQATFVLELIMALIARYEITSQEFFIHIEPYLGDKTRHFIHELYNFAISPHNMEAYDRLSNYSGPTHNQNQEDDDVQIESENLSTRHAGSAPLDPTKLPLRRILIKKKAENQWETVPVQSSSSAGTSAQGTSNPGPSTSGSSIFANTLPNDAANNSENEEECQILEVLRPKRERTPEIVDLSSDEEVPQVVIEVPSDDSEYTISGSSGTELDYPGWPFVCLAPEKSQRKTSSAFGNMISEILAVSVSPTSSYTVRYPPSPSRGSDSEIECVYSGQTTSKNTPVPSSPIPEPVSSTTITTENLQVALQALKEDVTTTETVAATPSEEPTDTKVEESTSSKNEPEPKKPKLSSAIVRPWEGLVGQAGRSSDPEGHRKPPRMKRRLPKTPTRYTSSSDDSDESDDKEPVKKLKLRSVVAHFTFDSSGQKCESRHRPSHKKRKHKDKKKRVSKEKRKHSHRHKHRIYSDSDSS